MMWIDRPKVSACCEDQRRLSSWLTLHVSLYPSEIGTERPSVANRTVCSLQEKHTVQYVIPKPSLLCVETKIHPLSKGTFILAPPPGSENSELSFFVLLSSFKTENESLLFVLAHFSVFSLCDLKRWFCFDHFLTSRFHFCLVCYFLLFLLHPPFLSHTPIHQGDGGLYCTLHPVLPVSRLPFQCSPWQGNSSNQTERRAPRHRLRKTSLELPPPSTLNLKNAVSLSSCNFVNGA